MADKDHFILTAIGPDQVGLVETHRGIYFAPRL